MKRLIQFSLLTLVLSVWLAGCTRSDPEVFVLQPIEPRPELNSVPRDAVFVAQMAAPGGFNYELQRNQRYYLVDLDADRVINSGKSDRRGQLTVGSDGATLNGRRLWGGDATDATRIGLFVSDRPERS